jgi:hypothetical protein
VPTFVFTSPDGEKHEVAGPEGATEAQAFQVLQTRLSARDKQRKADAELYDPSKGMSPLEKGVVGVGRSFDRLYRGARDLVRPDDTVSGQELENRQNEREGAKSYETHHPGGWATAGEVAGDIIATAPVGGVLGAASRALPAAGRLAAVGGRFVNPGTAGRAATEAATVAGVEAPGEDESRLGNMAQAAVLAPIANKVVPAVVGGAKELTKYAGRKIADWTQKAVTGTAGERQAAINAINSLDRTVGREGIDAAADAVRNPTPSMFPRTTAAMSGNRQLGALEAGTSIRPSGAGFTKHREDVARKSWQELQDATQSASHEAGDISGLGIMSDDAAENAIKAAQKVRETFMKNGFPKTTRSFGSTTEGTAVPEIGEKQLRTTLAEHAGRMVPEEAQQAGRIVDELVPQEISKSGQHVGPTQVTPSGLVSAANAALNVLPQWRWRGVAQAAIRGSNKKEQELIDRALLKPDEFLKMVETQRALGRPVTGWQAKVRDAMLGAQAREIGAQSAGD